MYSLRLRAVLKVTHSADGFGLLAGVTVAFMEHLGVAFLSAPILGVLKAFKEVNVEEIVTISQYKIKYSVRLKLSKGEKLALNEHNLQRDGRYLQHRVWNMGTSSSEPTHTCPPG